MKTVDTLSCINEEYINSECPLAVMIRAAIEVLQFTHPKLAVTAVVSEQDFATVLDRRLKRIEQMKLLEKKTINGNAVVSEMTIKPEPQPAPPTPAPLNRIYDKRRYRRI